MFLCSLKRFLLFTKLLQDKYIVVSLTVKYYRGFQGGTKGISAGQEVREWGICQVGSAFNMQKAQADGSPDRMVRTEILTAATERGMQGTKNNNNNPTIAVTVRVTKM